MKALVIALLLVAALAGCGSSSSGATAGPKPSSTVRPESSPTALTVTPILTLKRGPASFPNFTKTATGCKGIHGYQDLHKGAGVTIYSARGDVVGTGFIRLTVVEGSSCGMVARVSNLVPASYYQVEFANRGKVAFSRAALVNSTETVTLG